MKTNRFTYLISALLPVAALAVPVYGQQTNATITNISTKTIQVDDDSEAIKPNAYQLFGQGDPKMDSISRQIDHYGKLIYNYDHSKAYETLNAKAKGFSTTAPAFYDNDTLRHIMAGINKISKDFNTSGSRDLALKRDSIGHLIGDYFKTQKFREANSKLLKEYDIDPAKNYTNNDADYQRYHDELLKKLPEKIKNNLQELKELSAEFRNMLQSPEYVADVRQLHVLLDSMKNYYKKPHVVQYTYANYEATMDVPADERRKAQDELRAYLQNTEFHSFTDKLNDYAKEMRDYYQNTPVVKEHEEAWKNELKTLLADDYDSIVHPGRGLGHLFSN